MIINYTQPRQYTTFAGPHKVVFVPGYNSVSDDLFALLKKHPGFKSRLDMGIIKIVASAAAPGPVNVAKVDKDKANLDMRKAGEAKMAAEAKADAEAKATAKAAKAAKAKADAENK